MDTIHMNPQTESPAIPQGIQPSDSMPKYAVARVNFAATTKERILAILSYPAAYLYACAAMASHSIVFPLFAAFTLVFVIGVEYISRDIRAGWERWVWLAAAALCVLPPLWGGGKVWAEGGSLLFLHGFAIYYTLCRTDRLMEGRTSHLLPMDAIWGTFVIPFANIILRLRTLGTFPRTKKAKGITVLWSALAVLAGAVALYMAISLLTQADTGFAGLTVNLLEWLSGLEFTPVLVRLLLSIPVGAYLYGLVAGSRRLSEEKMRDRGIRICRGLEQFREVPVRVWIILLSFFAVVYAVFFFIQGKYLFGAFSRTLPEDFTVAEYARQGFFELCKVMVLNFALLWAALRSAKVSHREHRVLRIAATVILAESLLLAVTAASKLWLYIDCFGFTPLRLQSAWLITALSAGVIAAVWYLWTGKRSMRVWAMFSGLTLALLHLV